MQTVTTLDSHETKSGSKNGREWHLHVFTAADGSSYSTFDTDVANKAYALLNKAATVVFDQKPSSNPAYPPRNTITGIMEAVAEARPSVPSSIIPATPASSSGAVYTVHPGVVTDEERQIRIMRQSAIDRAIAASAAGLISPGLEAVYAFSEELIQYFQNGTKRVAPQTLEDEFAGTL